MGNLVSHTSRIGDVVGKKNVVASFRFDVSEGVRAGNAQIDILNCGYLGMIDPLKLGIVIFSLCVTVTNQLNCFQETASGRRPRAGIGSESIDQNERWKLGWVT